MNARAIFAAAVLVSISASRLSAAEPWTDKPFMSDPANFQFAVVSDRGGGIRPGVFEEMIDKLNILQPEFVICVGDLIAGYTEDGKTLKKQRNELLDIVNRLDARFYFVPGNHDIGNEFMIKDWEKRFGETYYAFNYQDVLFIVLNSQDPPEHRIGDIQIDWLRQELEKNPKPRWTFVFLHTPLWLYEPTKNGWDKIEPLLKGRQLTVFSGHTHSYGRIEGEAGTYITMATTGGGSAQTGPKGGEFDHAAWVTMGRRGPRIANIMLEGILDEKLSESILSVYRRLKESLEVKMNSSLIEGPDRMELDAVVEVSNLGDSPLLVNLKWRKHPDFRPDPKKAERSVKPNSVEHLRFRLRSRRPIDVNDFFGVYVDYRAVLDEKNIPAAEIKGKRAFGYDRRHECPRAAAPVSVDGILTDWPDLPIEVKNPRDIGLVPNKWRGPQDAWFRFGTQHDADFVYFAVEAHDDKETKTDRDYWQRDAVFIGVDPRSEQELVAAWEKGDPGKPIIYGQTPDGQMPDYYQVTLPEGAKWACIPGREGWTAELAIPRGIFQSDRFRLNVAQIDTDGDEEWGSMQAWRPGWGDEDDFPESGWFVFK